MALIFCNVEADIDGDLISKFPKEFDFDAMLRKICEDAGVSVIHNNLLGVNTFINYRLKGCWLPMEKVYKHLVTSLAQCAPKLLSQAFAGDTFFLNEERKDSAATGLPLLNSTGADTARSADVLKSVQEGSRRPRRPRKSARQSRKTYVESCEEDDLPSSEAENNHGGSHEVNTRDLALDDPTGNRSQVIDSAQTRGDEGSSAEDGSGNTDGLREQVGADGAETKFEDVVKKPAKRRSANKRKSAPPLKKVQKRKQGRLLHLPATGDNEPPPVRKRGRPKLYDDEGVTEFPCSECTFVASKRSQLNTHRLRVHEASPVKCDLCPKVFPSKRYMLRHRASHTEPQHCCDVCGKMYKIRKAMLEHRKTHDGDYQKPKVTCDQCRKTFCNRYILECHIKDIHMGQKKSYLCATCGKSFTTRHSLREHTNAHIGVKPHVCEICGKSFSYESALRDHRFTHAEAKHFWCKHCQKGFSQRSGLKMHMRIHKQQKMFVCSECGRGFTQKQALQRHERVHKGEKPFVCKHCGRLFTDASIIRRHLILVHKINKDAKAWREDIVCTVKPQNEYQVQRITQEEEDKEAERAKNELFVKAVGGAQPRVSNKGPSRAFSRTYPRRVALLDEQGNVIAPPEVIQQSVVVNKTKKIKDTNLPIPLENSQILLAPENIAADLDVSAHVLSQRYVEAPQWEAVAEHLVARESGTGNAGNSVVHQSSAATTTTTHMEHIILEEPGQANMEHVQAALPKLIKYEMQPGVAGASVVSVPGGGIVVGLNDVSISNSISDPTRATIVAANTFLQQNQQQQQQQQQQSQLGDPTSNPSPLSFTVSTAQPVSQTSFDSLNPQAPHTSSILTPSQLQYFDGRSTGLAPGAKNVGAPGVHAWPSTVLYYSQLASQFGMSINPDYPYVSGAVTSSSSHLGEVQMSGQQSPPLHQGSATTTTFILQAHPEQLHSLQDLESATGMKAGLDSQNATVLHLDSCEDQQQQHEQQQQAGEMTMAQAEDAAAADIPARHLGGSVADELVLLQQNFQHHHHQPQHQHHENASPIIIAQPSSHNNLHHQQHQQQVDLVEHLANPQDITAEQHTILVQALDGVARHSSPSIEMRAGEDSLVNVKSD